MAYEFLNSSIGVLLKWNSFLGLGILTLILTFFIVVVYKYTTDQEALKKLRDDNIRIKEEMKTYKDNPQKLMELQKEQLKKAFFEQFKHQLKPMIITIIPMGIVFIYLREFYSNSGNPVLIFRVTYGWIIAYIGFSIIFNGMLRKLLKVY